MVVGLGLVHVYRGLVVVGVDLGVTTRGAAVVAVVVGAGGFVVDVDGGAAFAVKIGVRALSWAAVGLGASVEAKLPSPSSQ